MCSATELCPLPNQLRCFENMASFFIVCVFVCIHVCMCVSAHVHVRALRTVWGGGQKPTSALICQESSTFFCEAGSLTRLKLTD